MSESSELRAQRASRAARSWAAVEAARSSDDVLDAVNRRAAQQPLSPAPRRYRSVAVAASLLTVTAIAGLLALSVRDSDRSERVVPASAPSVATTMSSPPTSTSAVTTSSTSTENIDEQIRVDIDGAAIEQLVPPFSLRVDRGEGPGEVGAARCDRCPPGEAIVIGAHQWVVVDDAQARVHVFAPAELRRPGEMVAPLQQTMYGDGTVAAIGAPVAVPSGALFVPVVVDTSAAATSVDRWEDTDQGWTLIERFDVPGASVDDVFRLDGDAVVHVGSADTVTRVVPLDESERASSVRRDGDELVVTSADGVTARWVLPIDGEVMPLTDGSVVIAASQHDAAVDGSLVMRLWPDGISAVGRIDAAAAVGYPIGAGSSASIATVDVVDDALVVGQWPLPSRAAVPPVRPDETLPADDMCLAQFRTDEANSVALPWTIVGGRVGDRGVWVAAFDALGRLVSGGCGTSSTPLDTFEAAGSSIFRIGDVQYVLTVKPQSTGGIADAPTWLGEPIATSTIDSLTTDAAIYGVADDADLPVGDDPDETLLIAQLLAARRTPITSSGIGVHTPVQPPPVADPHDLAGRATPFVQDYLDALAEQRWDDAATYIEHGGALADRAAFVDLIDHVGDTVDIPAALSTWCTLRRDCTGGTAIGVIQQSGPTEVTVVVSFDIPGATSFDPVADVGWTVTHDNGQLHIDGIPQQPR